MTVLHVAASSNDIHMLDFSINEIERQAKENILNTDIIGNIDIQNQDVINYTYSPF